MIVVWFVSHCAEAQRRGNGGVVFLAVTHKRSKEDWAVDGRVSISVVSKTGLYSRT